MQPVRNPLKESRRKSLWTPSRASDTKTRVLSRILAIFRRFCFRSLKKVTLSYLWVQEASGGQAKICCASCTKVVSINAGNHGPTDPLDYKINYNSSRLPYLASYGTTIGKRAHFISSRTITSIS